MKSEAKKPQDVLCIDCAHLDKWGYCEAPENQKPLSNPLPKRRLGAGGYVAGGYRITRAEILNKERDCAYHKELTEVS